MNRSQQAIHVSRDGVVHGATISWQTTEDWRYEVAVESAAFDRVEARADDAFEALCRVREELEPHGWRLGVAGAQADVWPSGMARDQGGGRVAYRMTAERVEGLVGTFDPVDPATVATVADQRAETSRLLDEIRCNAGGG
jgi:hypothetical protein